jgi:hypothetical protein
MDDMFNWGNDRFVLGQIGHSGGGNSTLKKKKTAREVFMEASQFDEDLPPVDDYVEEKEAAPLDEGETEGIDDEHDDYKIDPRDALDN